MSNERSDKIILLTRKCLELIQEYPLEHEKKEAGVRQLGMF